MQLTAANIAFAEQSAEFMSQIAARLVAEAIPREYERAKDWGRTKRMTVGLRSSGNFFDFDIHRRKKDVRDGVWSKYRMTLVEPERHFDIQISNVRQIAPARIAMTLYVTAKVEGWVRTRVYERGVHLVSLEAVGTTSVKLWIDSEVAFESATSSAFLPSLAMRPRVTNARIELDDFRLKRISDVRGAVAHEIGDGLRRVIEDELSGQNLVSKLNRSIARRQDQFNLSPERLLGDQSAIDELGRMAERSTAL